MRQQKIAPKKWWDCPKTPAPDFDEPEKCSTTQFPGVSVPQCHAPNGDCQDFHSVWQNLASGGGLYSKFAGVSRSSATLYQYLLLIYHALYYLRLFILKIDRQTKYFAISDNHPCKSTAKRNILPFFLLLGKPCTSNSSFTAKNVRELSF